MATITIVSNTILDYDKTEEQRGSVKTLSKRLDEGGDFDGLRGLAQELTETRDWQVRHDMALLITKLPKSDASWFTERLTDDSNA